VLAEGAGGHAAGARDFLAVAEGDHCRQWPGHTGCGLRVVLSVQSGNDQATCVGLGHLAQAFFQRCVQFCVVADDQRNR